MENGEYKLGNYYYRQTRLSFVNSKLIMISRNIKLKKYSILNLSLETDCRSK